VQNINRGNQNDALDKIETLGDTEFSAVLVFELTGVLRLRECKQTQTQHRKQKSQGKDGQHPQQGV
jgi:hypothetical protein